MTSSTQRSLSTSPRPRRIRRMSSSSCPTLSVSLLMLNSPCLLKSFCLYRVLAYHPCSSVSALYELPSQVLYSAVLYLLFAGRVRWTCCKSIGSGVEVWGCIRYGDRPVSSPPLPYKPLYSCARHNQVVQLPVCCAISRLHIPSGPLPSNSSSHSTSAVTTCT